MSTCEFYFQGLSTASIKLIIAVSAGLNLNEILFVTAFIKHWFYPRWDLIKDSHVTNVLFVPGSRTSSIQNTSNDGF